VRESLEKDNMVVKVNAREKERERKSQRERERKSKIHTNSVRMSC